MKTAVSIPDPIFELAEVVANRLGLSRSELYARALVMFLDKHSRKGITEKLNMVYANEPSQLDAALQRMQASSIYQEAW